MVRRALLFIASASLVACGAPKSSVKGSVTSDELEKELQNTERPHFLDWNENKDSVASYFRFNCEDCPTSFGQLISITPVDKNKVRNGNCQGGLIGEDLFFTSRHCVPNDLLEKGASCAGRIKVIFPGIGHQMPIEEVGCESIEDLAPIVDGLNPQAPQPDWAILKLSKKLPQRVSATTTEGAEDGEKLYAFAPLWDPRNNTITTRTIECEAVQNSLEFPNFSKRSSIMMYLYCSQKMTNGFSGTLLFDSKGKDAKVVGAVSHIYNPDARGQEVHLSDKVIASNLSCILADPKKPIPDECQFKKGERHDKGKRLWKRFLPKLKEKADELFADWEKVADSPIEWTKIDKDNWNQLPESYEQYFKKFQEKGFQDLEGEETNEYAQIVVPSFAKCVKDPATAKNKEIIIPVLELKFNRQNRGRARPEIKLLEIKGRIHKNSDTEFVIVREDSLPGSPDGKDYIFTGYFSHSTAMPPCE